ncbi:unnamed protein product [Schistosoma turkestanicum]|nr:unnamed protein product [Schistosoma turkestanicum]
MRNSTADYAQGQFDHQFPFQPPTSSSTPSLSGTEVENIHQINCFFENPTSLIRFCHGSLINVTILLGIFDCSNGLPLIGVINQPFYLNNMNSDSNHNHNNSNNNISNDEINSPYNYGRIIWGYNFIDTENSSTTNHMIYANNSSTYIHLDHELDNLNFPKQLRFPNHFFDCLCPDRVFSDEKPILKVACSSMEFSRLTNLFHDYKDTNQNLVNVVFLSSSGAGFKQLCLILDEVDAFILMEPTTFLWDTCGPHTIMNSFGGGIIQLKYALNSVKALIQKQNNIPINLDSIIQWTLNDLNKFQIKYNSLKTMEEIQTLNSMNLANCCNRDGLLAYRNPLIASQILVHIALNQN